ncbi:MAG: DinB family protein [Calditrichaeota bacterium]|nr:MAG: DinB family protein [Calditrichota bacterium]MBL1204321.1 DinB family protein [Calditrichota bacterium]NOG44151.1 hypothetical protein [Calditrichota bacterium]
MTNLHSVKSKKAKDLAERIAKGAKALELFVKNLSESDWQTPVLVDGRTIGVVVHHVASSYPMEIELAQTLASGQPITGATMDVVDQINADHAEKYASVNKKETLELLKQNSLAAADSVRKLSDAQLEKAAPVSLNADAPLTAQFFIEDHALRHSYHHLARIRETLGL